MASAVLKFGGMAGLSSGSVASSFHRRLRLFLLRYSASELLTMMWRNVSSEFRIARRIRRHRRILFIRRDVREQCFAIEGRTQPTLRLRGAGFIVAGHAATISVKRS